MSARSLQLLAAGTAAPPDTTPPTITSSSTDSVAENSTLSHALTADETVTWSIVGGADQTKFEISGSTLRWTSNGTKDFETPDDADTNNTYIVTVRATDLASNTTDQTITVTVTDVVEWVSTFSQTLGDFDVIWVGRTMRQIIPASLISTSGSTIRLTLKSGLGEGTTLDGVYIGEQAGAGDVYDAASLTQVLFSGSGSVTIPVNSTTVSDALTFSLDETKTYILSAHFSDAANDSVARNTSVTGADCYIKASASEAATANVSGYSQLGPNVLYLVTKIEVGV